MSARGLIIVLAMALGGCLFIPNVEQHGYTACASDADCVAGRNCEAGICATPPWNDDAFGERRLLVLTAEEAVPEGVPVPVRIGAGGVIASEDLGSDGRFTFYEDSAGSGTAGTWRDVPVFLDIFGDHLIAWVPSSGIAAGESKQLAWVENSTAEITANITIDPEAVFSDPALFDDFEGDALGPDWESYGTGTPAVSESEVTVADNQRIVLARALDPPFSLTLRGRINGANCDRFFLGLEGDEASSYAPPSVGFFATGALEAIGEVAPDVNSIPQPVVQGIALDTAEHRYRIDVGEGQVAFYIDDELIPSDELRPPLDAPDGLYVVVDVDGDCSFELERVLVSPLPLTGVTITAEPKASFQIFD